MHPTISLFDTLSRQIKPIPTPPPSNHFKLYCCGPTVYGPAHIGNFRTFLIQDVFRRLLEVTGYSPLHVRNLTDVDDKTIRQSQAEGISLHACTQKWTQKFHHDCSLLNMLPPHVEPTATAHIPQQIQMIQTLLQKNHAYISPDSSVYFRVNSFPQYGKLAHLNRDQLQSQDSTSQGKPNLADEYDRESISDFALWKAHKPEDGPNSWPSPWGPGRPGWHIECSAMSQHYLGDTYELHSGGIDLCFPHHENEIAQSECCSGKTFVLHWMHISHLQVDGQKMSKSLKNLYTLEDLLNQGFDAPSIRYTLIAGHYRHPLNFTFQSLNASKNALAKLAKWTQSLLSLFPTPPTSLSLSPDSLKNTPFQPNFFSKAWSALLNDLNIPACLAEIFTLINSTSPSSLPLHDAQALLSEFSLLLFTLGISLPLSPKEPSSIPQNIKDLAEKRWLAKLNKDYASADQLRIQLEQLGWKSLDSKDTYSLQPLHS